MGASSSKKKEQERKEKMQKEKEEKMKNAKKDLEGKIADLEKKIEENDKKAKEIHNKAKERLAEGDRDGAKKFLNKEKKIKAQIENINNALMMLDDQLMTLENAEIFGGITSAVKEGIDVLKADQNKVSKTDLENMYASFNDIKQSIQDLGNYIGDNNNLDDIDVDEEFDKLEEDILNEESKEFPLSNKEKLEKEKEKNNQNNMIEA